MRIEEAIQKIKKIYIPKNSKQVFVTVADEFKNVNENIEVNLFENDVKDESGIFVISSADTELGKNVVNSKPKDISEEFIYFQINESGSGKIIVSHQNFLYSFVMNIIENWSDNNVQKYEKCQWIKPAFKWNRTLFDYFLNQMGRVQRNFDKASYIKDLARMGITHVEVNGLAYPMGLESGPKGETYPMFYTYCPALDQFVYSELNKGLYPFHYLSANLNYLKESATIAEKYGLTPGMMSFEPRSVPEQFFDRYPMLRGARVDHPFRSFQPRYNMTITHPKVREHYAEMMKKLLNEVPELGFLSIWTNDSGAGFEHTRSLYVGRNGGAYLIREWKDDEEIARLAGDNIMRYLFTLRDAAQEINPDFRVITRLESFYGEHDTIWNSVGNNVDIEGVSIISRGWEMPYTHPKYPDSQDINGGSVHHQGFDDKETDSINDLKNRGALAHFFFSVGPHAMFDPLIGVPSPNLVYQKLKTMNEKGVETLAHLGGSFPPNLVPFNVNFKVVQQFQYDQNLDVTEAIAKLAANWAGDEFAPQLVKAWELAEETILAFPNVVPMYSTFGFTWYRLWARPFVPNLEAIPAEERAYYEDFMCTTPHNPNNVDLSRDVLFILTTPEKSKVNVQRIDQNCWQAIDEAIKILNGIEKEAAQKLGSKNVIHDQLIRLRALRCWIMTQRNVAAWITGVYGYMDAATDNEKTKAKALLDDMIQKEIENTEYLTDLLKTDIEFMATSGMGETQLVYGDNLLELLPRRIALMKKHMDDEPYIDPDYIEKKAGQPISDF
jgi:hypothetical protein